jgi:SAM-dependent methyltransferase
MTERQPTPPTEADASSGSTTGLPAWADEGARRWLDHADQLEAMLEPVDRLLLPAADLRHGLSVLDVGCGRGTTSRAVALAVGLTGRVTGVDIAPAMIEAATNTPTADASAPVEWVTADAGTHAFAGRYDRIVSRFGTLFFDDPVAAYANLRVACRPHGRLAVAVWQPRDASEFQSLAVDVAVQVAAEAGHTLDAPPPDAGPFSFGRPEVMRTTLTDAGWRGIAIVPHRLPLYVGGPGATAEEVVALGRHAGPLAALLADAPSGIADIAAAAVLDELRRRQDGRGIPLEAAITVVTADAGPSHRRVDRASISE